MTDWVAWHAAYDDPASALVARLAAVRGHLATAIEQAPPGPVRLLSLCAGQGHDVLGVLPTHPRREDVTGVLVEFDPDNVARVRAEATAIGLDQVEVRELDASRPSGYADAWPVDVLLLCGIFGNISDADIQRTVAAASTLCAPHATVIWTRHRREPDLTGTIRDWFREAGFTELAFDALDTDIRLGVGANRAGAHPERQVLEEPLFTFDPSLRR